MKKVYAALAFAAMFGATAMAGNLDKTKSALELNGFSKEAGTTAIVRESTMQKALNIKTVDDLVGTYFMAFNSGFDNDDHSGNIIIEKGTGANDILIYGLVQRDDLKTGFPIKATVDISTRQITVPEQVVDPSSDWGAGGLKLIPYDFQKNTRQSASVLTICEQGITIGGTPAYEDGCIAGLGATAFWFATEASFAESKGIAILFNVVNTPVSLYGDENQQMFEYKAADWVSCGEGTYNDGFVNITAFWGDKLASAYKVEVLQKADGSKEFLIKNPYGTNTPWANVNSDASKPGYIYINAINPECVLVKPNVYSGYNDQEIWPMGQLFFANNEGYLYYMNQYSYEEIQEEADYYGDTLSTMATTGDNATINIRNGQVATVCDLATYAAYTLGGNEPFACTPSTLEFKVAGVEGVINDAENVPARYFNLQGVELSNPEAGQVVIVKQGSKSFKTIAK